MGHKEKTHSFPSADELVFEGGGGGLPGPRVAGHIHSSQGLVVIGSRQGHIHTSTLAYLISSPLSVN